MTRFLIATGGMKPLLAVAATHGLTDLDSSAWVGRYAVLTLLPLPSPLITMIFCVASLLHFSEDVGFLGSALVHAGVGLAGIAMGVQAAFKAMVSYLAFCHVPMHFVRCYHRNRKRSALATAGVTMAAIVASTQLGEWVPLTDNMQRVVIAHILTEHSVGATVAKTK